MQRKDYQYVHLAPNSHQMRVRSVWQGSGDPEPFKENKQDSYFCGIPAAQRINSARKQNWASGLRSK